MTLHAAIQNVRFYLRDMEQAGLFADDQLVAAAPPVPPDGGSPAAITISDLRAILERHPNDRWNIEEDGAALLVCRGDHERAAGCRFDRYVPADHANSEIGESDNGAAPAAALEVVRHVKRGTEYEVLGEAEVQISTRCTAPDGPGNGVLPNSTIIREARPGYYAGDLLVVYRDKVTGKLWCRLPDEFRDGRFETLSPAAAEPIKGTIKTTYLEGRMQHWLGEAQRLAALVTALGGNPEPDAPQPAYTAMQERTDICKALGCVDEPGMPLRHVLDVLTRKSKAYQRELELLRSWDKANLTERQELDRFRRGWGPSTPTERQRRLNDVLGCLRVLSGAMTELSLPEKDMEPLGDEANAYIAAAYERLDKRHSEMLAIVEVMNADPQEWPDIRAAEERGAMAMRVIVKERISGLKIIQTPMQSVWEVENRAFDGAVFQIETAPMPRDYHGNAREKVQKILANAKPAA